VGKDPLGGRDLKARLEDLLELAFEGTGVGASNVADLTSLAGALPGLSAGPAERIRTCRKQRLYALLGLAPEASGPRTRGAQATAGRYLRERAPCARSSCATCGTYPGICMG
jgi:hypothetical protein